MKAFMCVIVLLISSSYANAKTCAVDDVSSKGLISEYKISECNMEVNTGKDGKPFSTTHLVDKRIFGEYNLCASQLKGFEEYAQTIKLNADGTGFLHKYGDNKKKMKFKWGALITKGSSILHVKKIKWKGDMVPAYYIMYWGSEGIGAIPVYDIDGGPQLEGPYGSKIKQHKC